MRAFTIYSYQTQIRKRIFCIKKLFWSHIFIFLKQIARIKICISKQSSIWKENIYFQAFLVYTRIICTYLTKLIMWSNLCIISGLWYWKRIFSALSSCFFNYCDSYIELFSIASLQAFDNCETNSCCSLIVH